MRSWGSGPMRVIYHYLELWNKSDVEKAFLAGGCRGKQNLQSIGQDCFLTIDTLPKLVLNYPTSNSSSNSSPQKPEKPILSFRTGVRFL